MRSLIKESHAFTVEESIAEYEDRLIRPIAVFDQNNIETVESSAARFKNYDDYEINDLLLSRMVVESLLTAAFREKLDTRFSHVSDYDELPGQILFMMTLEACNASANMDVEG